jgi:hypothetical protein
VSDPLIVKQGGSACSSFLFHFFASWVLCFTYISEEMSKLELAEKALQAKLQEKGK